MKMIIGMSILALIISAIVFPFALRFALKHNIVDNPNARKLQKEPVPVFGGIAVVMGILIPLVVSGFYFQQYSFWTASFAILVLWSIGVTDDIRGIGALIRLVIEMLLVWFIIWKPYSFENGYLIENLYGLWGVHRISPMVALPMTIVAGAGIINSINLIDGVDGYSSGYGMVANLLFAIVFYSIGNYPMATFSAVTAGALIPFYCHNVFGKKTKMFIGDGGSLVIGLVMAYDVMALFSSNNCGAILEEQGVGVVALALAILCIPVFDTLRVMLARLIRHKGVFNPDKTHFHHLFISLGFSHVGTSTIIILTNMLIVLIWFILYMFGASIDLQFYAVALLGLSTWVFYYGMRYAQKKKNKIWKLYTKFGAWTHFEDKGGWLLLEKFFDKL